MRVPLKMGTLHMPISNFSLGSGVNIDVGFRSIQVGDELLLQEEERRIFENAIPKLQRQSGAARDVARVLLKSKGKSNVTIGKALDGNPMWPKGIVGSLAHDDKIAVAAIANKDDLDSLGVDIEPDLELPHDVISIVLTEREHERYADKVRNLRQFFILKEAVYKAWYPLFKTYLDYQEIEIEIEALTARIVSSNVNFELAFRNVGHLIGLAYIRASPALEE